MPKKIILVAGQKFGRLEFIKDAGYNAKKKPLIEVRCECDGKVIIRVKSAVMNGATTSCGCFRKETMSKNMTKHGLADTKEYDAWLGMKKRCYNENCEDYQYYGERGIIVAPEWINDFKAFYDHIGAAPIDGYAYSIDRINTNGNYEPNNVRWATNTEQARNKRNNEVYTIGGITKPLITWAEENDINVHSVRTRLNAGIDVKAALTTDIKESRTITANNKTQTIAEWAKELGFTTAGLNHRLERGWTDEEVVNTPYGKRIKPRNKMLKP